MRARLAASPRRPAARASCSSPSSTASENNYEDHDGHEFFLLSCTSWPSWFKGFGGLDEGEIFWRRGGCVRPGAAGGARIRASLLAGRVRPKQGRHAERRGLENRMDESACPDLRRRQRRQG